MPLPQSVTDLIERFTRNLETYKSSDYNETRLRIEFLDPLFQSLGWDIANSAGYADAYKDVTHEDAIKIGGATKAPDYCFRIGGARKFFLEAKKPSIDIKGDPSPAYQLRRYAWSAKLPISVLSDFEEFAIYDTRAKPSVNDKSSAARIFYCTYTELPEKWDYISAILSKDAVWKGSFDKFAESTKSKRGTAEVDDAFLEEIEHWRNELATNIALRNPEISERDLNVAVTKTIDRIVFLRICEDRGVEIYAQLQTIAKTNDIYSELLKLFRRADEKYNSGLFHFSKEKDRPEEPDTLTPSLNIDDKTLRPILTSLYYPDCPYEFSVLPSDILGHVYEQFLGKVIRLTSGHRAKVEEKPEVRKAGGVYYTPTYIVNYIVQNTVGKLLGESNASLLPASGSKAGLVSESPTPPITPKEAAKLKILDPACGSGSFLLGAYQYLLDWHLLYYNTHNPEQLLKQKNPPIYQTTKSDGPAYRLTTTEKKRILLNNIYGVDIDQNAVETTKLSLLLKVLENESSESIANQRKLFRERALPDLANNIKCGNSLIAPDFYENEQLNLLDDDATLYKINAFNWNEQFPAVINTGGFDAVIGNPPYIDSEWMTEYHPKERKYLASKYKAASGNWDIFCVFIEKATVLCRNGGYASLIVPNKLGAALYASAARRILTAENSLKIICDYSAVPVFPVAVYPIIFVVRATRPELNSVVLYQRIEPEKRDISLSIELSTAEQFSTPELPWNIFSSAPGGKLAAKIKDALLPLKAVATVTGAATVDEAYKIKKILKDQNVAGDHFRLVNSGTIDRYVDYWGKANCRYIKSSYLHPVVEESDLRNISVTRLAQAKKPKIIISGMTKTLECAIDPAGHMIAGKSTSIVLSVLDLRYLLALLNSKVINYWYSETYGGNRLAGGYLRIGPPQIEMIPIRPLDINNPHDQSKHDRIIKLVDRMLSLHQRLAKAKSGREQIQRQIVATDKQIDDLVYELYQLTPEEIQLVEAATPE
jgi:predicted type IV restriction endonuclease